MKRPFGMKYLLNNRSLLILYLCVVPLCALSSAMFSLSLQPLMDVVYNPSLSLFAESLVTLLLWAIADELSHFIHKLVREKIRVNYNAGLRRDLFHGIMRGRMATFFQSSVAQYISVVNRDVSRMSECHFDAICGMYRVMVNFAVNLFFVLRISPWFAFLNLSMSGLSALIPRLYEKRLTEKQNKASALSEKYYAVLSDAFRGFSTIRLFRFVHQIEKKTEDANCAYENASCESIMINDVVSRISGAFSTIGYIGTIVLGIYFALRGWITVGMVLAVSQLVGGLLVPFEELPEHLSNLHSVRDLREKLRKIIHQETAMDVAGQASLPERISFSLSHVSFAYDEKTILSDVSFSLEEGKKYILIGASGSGKSTIAGLLMRFYECTSGQIFAGSEPLSAYGEDEYYRAIAYLEQDVFLFDDTLRYNITLYGEYEETQIDHAVRASGLESLVRSLPEGLETIVRGNGNNFSGGERQRIGIARAILSGAKYFILDEMTTGLDPVLGGQLEKMVLSMEGIGMLMITHNHSEALFSMADGVLMLENRSVHMRT